MIELDPSGKLPPDPVLDHFAQAIVSCTFSGTEIRHYGYKGSYEISYLAEKVEELTQGKLTVRPADVILFKDHIRSPDVCYLVRCSADTPKGEVRDLTDDMLLMTFDNFLDIPVERANPEHVAWERNKSRRADARQLERQRLQSETQPITNVVNAALNERINSIDDQEMIYDLRRLLNDASISNLLVLCAKLGVNLDKLIRDATPE